MATADPLGILGDDDNDGPAQLVAAVQQPKVAAKKPALGVSADGVGAPLEAGHTRPNCKGYQVQHGTAPVRGGGIGGGRGCPGRGRGHGGSPGRNREYGNGNANGFLGTYGGGTGAGGEEGVMEKLLERECASYGGPRQTYRGGRRVGYRHGESGEDCERLPRRLFECCSSTGCGNELKRMSFVLDNWGTPNDDVIAEETEEIVNHDGKSLTSEKQPGVEGVPSSYASKENNASNENEEKEPEHKEGFDKMDTLSGKKKSKKRAKPGPDGDLSIKKPADTEIMHEPDCEYDMSEPTMGEKLASLSLLGDVKSNHTSKEEASSEMKPPSVDSVYILLKQALHAKDHALLLNCLYTRDEKVITNSISMLKPSDVLSLLEFLLSMIHSRGAVLICCLPWLRGLLAQHASSIISQESSLFTLNSLYQLIDSRISTFGTALQLSTCLDNIFAGIPEDEDNVLPPVIYEDKDSDDEQDYELLHGYMEC